MIGEKSKSMKILVTGARGVLGTDLCAIFAEEYQIKATDIEDMDVRRRDIVSDVVSQFRPEMIIHLTALTDVDACERNPDVAFQTNTIGTQNVALVCQQFDIPMVYVSTISVFDGTKPEAYTEYDTPNPQSYYSRSKYQGELIVQSLLRKYYIVRAGWMFGGGKRDKKFVAKIIELAQTRSSLKVVNDKFGSPIYTRDFAEAIKRIITTGQYGVFHAVNTGGPVSRFEIAQAILQFANITSCELFPVCSAEFPLPAPRPRMEAGRNLVMELLGMTPMRHWRVALQEYIQTML